MFDPWSAFMSWAAKKGCDKLYSKVTAWFTTPTARGVLIIGPGGVGKTTLGQFLSGQEDKAASGSYVESVSTEEFKLADNAAVQILIPPGRRIDEKRRGISVSKKPPKGNFVGSFSFMRTATMRSAISATKTTNSTIQIKDSTYSSTTILRVA